MNFIKTVLCSVFLLSMFGCDFSQNDSNESALDIKEEIKSVLSEKKDLFVSKTVKEDNIPNPIVFFDKVKLDKKVKSLVLYSNKDLYSYTDENGEEHNFYVQKSEQPFGEGYVLRLYDWKTDSYIFSNRFISGLELSTQDRFIVGKENMINYLKKNGKYKKDCLNFPNEKLNLTSTVCYQ